MAKKKEAINENYLENIPVRQEGLRWDADEKGMVTLYVHNTGLMKKITQKLLKKPEYTQVHLDENGSFVWPLIDGEKNIIEIGVQVMNSLVRRQSLCIPDWQSFFRY